MKTGDYDVVSASGDATLRLIAAGDVAPVNTDLVPNYADIQPLPQGPRLELRRRPDVRHPARLGRQPADVQHRRRQARADELVGACSTEPRDVRRQGHGVRLADLHRRRRALPDEHPARPRHQEPLRARRGPARRRRSTCSRRRASRSASTGRTTSRSIQAFKTGDTVIGTTWQFIANALEAEKAPVEAILPDEGSTGWSDTWMVAPTRKHSELRLRVAGLHREPGGQRPGRGVLRRGAGQRQGVRAHRGQDASATPTTPTTRPTPRRSGTGRRRSRSASTGAPTSSAPTTAEWTQAWTEVKG